MLTCCLQNLNCLCWYFLESDLRPTNIRSVPPKSTNRLKYKQKPIKQDLKRNAAFVCTRSVERAWHILQILQIDTYVVASIIFFTILRNLICKQSARKLKFAKVVRTLTWYSVGNQEIGTFIHDQFWVVTIYDVDSDKHLVCNFII